MGNKATVTLVYDDKPKLRQRKRSSAPGAAQGGGGAKPAVQMLTAVPFPLRRCPRPQLNRPGRIQSSTTKITSPTGSVATFFACSGRAISSQKKTPVQQTALKRKATSPLKSGTPDPTRWKVAARRLGLGLGLGLGGTSQLRRLSTWTEFVRSRRDTGTYSFTVLFF